MIYRYFTAKQSYRYIDVLPDLVQNYNDSPHRSLNGFAPSLVNKTNEDEIRYLMYKKKSKTKNPKEKEIAIQIQDW